MRCLRTEAAAIVAIGAQLRQSIYVRGTKINNNQMSDEKQRSSSTLTIVRCRRGNGIKVCAEFYSNFINIVIDCDCTSARLVAVGIRQSLVDHR